MPRDDASDPNIVARLKNFPPFEPEEEPEVAPTTPVPPVDEPETQEENAPETDVPLSPPVKPDEGSEDEQKKRTTEQFDKLKEHNAALKRENEEFKAKQVPQKNALDSLIPDNASPVTNVVPTSFQNNNTSLTPKEIRDTFAGLTDEQGYVDTGLLKETLLGLTKAKEDAERRAAESENRVKSVERRQEDFERKQVMKEVHALFPRLDPENAASDDPSTKFSQTFYDLFQGEVMRQWSNVGSADPMKVAAKVSDILYGQMNKADKEKAEKAELAKKNINATSVKPSTTHESYRDKDELVMATRRGDKGALAERLARSGY